MFKMFTPLLLLILAIRVQGEVYCYEAKPPLINDCTELLEATREWTLRPMQNIRKKWGLREEDGPRSFSLPQTFRVHRPATYVQNTCAIVVNVTFNGTGNDYEYFRPQRVLSTAITVTSACIQRRGGEGFGYPGTNQTVWANVGRDDNPQPLPPGDFNTPGSSTTATNVTVGDKNVELWISSGQTSVPTHDQSDNDTLVETS